MVRFVEEGGNYGQVGLVSPYKIVSFTGQAAIISDKVLLVV